MFATDDLLSLAFAASALAFGLQALLALALAAWALIAFGLAALGRRLLRVAAAAAVAWLFLAFGVALAWLAVLDLGVAVVFVLLAPLALTYGLRKARRHRARMRERGAGTLRGVLALVPLPLLVALCLLAALAQLALERGLWLEALMRLHGLPADAALPTQLSFANPVADAMLGLATGLGYVTLALFFLSVPFVMGRVVAAVLLVLDALGWRAPLRAPSPPDVAPGPPGAASARPDPLIP